jgi:hypothetical protein
MRDEPSGRRPLGGGVTALSDPGRHFVRPGAV